MADDNRYRSTYAPPSAPRARPDTSAEPARDPLAELARLVSQDDPFAGRRRDIAQDVPPSDVKAAPDWLARPVMRERRWDEPPLAEPAGVADRHAPAVTERRERHAPRFYDDHRDTAQAAPAYEEPQRAPHLASDDYLDDLPHNEAYDAPRPDDYYDEVPPEPRRGGLKIVAAVLGLMAVGTAGVFGYRAVFSGPRPGTPPPVISADTTPNKVVPAQNGDGQQGKLIYDRVGNTSQTSGEKLVSREEQPTVPDARALPSSASASLDEPRKVRTISIPGTQPVATEPAVPPPSVAAAPPVSVRPQAPPAPVAIRPAPPPAPAAPSRVASTAPAAIPASAGAAGNYVVQVSSQKSEADAQASFRALKAKYPGVVGDHQPVIRRADLGAKGVYYRAQIGPFGTSDDANQFCSSLKAAGGQCIVQKN